jgi:hypothetical protein
MSEFKSDNNTSVHRAHSLFVKTYAENRDNLTIREYKEQQVQIFNDRWNVFEQDAIRNTTRRNYLTLSPQYGYTMVDRITGKPTDNMIDNVFINVLDEVFSHHVAELSLTGQKSQKKEMLMFFFYKAFKLVMYDTYFQHLFKTCLHTQSDIVVNEVLNILEIVLKNIKFGNDELQINEQCVTQYIEHFKPISSTTQYTLSNVPRSLRFTAVMTLFASLVIAFAKNRTT